MEDYESAKLRLACLELAKQVALASCSGTYSIVTDAEKYLKFVKGESKTGVPAAKSDDEIPF
jgi:uncharacterized linocin/CFP29 family protein